MKDENLFCPLDCPNYQMNDVVKNFDVSKRREGGSIDTLLDFDTF